MKTKKGEEVLKGFYVEIDPETHKAFKAKCVMSGLKLKEKVAELMKEFAENK